MFGSRTIRPVVCAVLVVATAVGTLPAATRGCECPAPVRTAAPQPAAAAPSCCGAGATASCCPAGKARHTCCGQPAAPKPAAPAGCECVVCGCETPDVPPPADSTPPAPPTDADTLELAAAPFAPPAILPPPTADRPPPSAVASLPPPTDLVSTFSRLTC